MDLKIKTIITDTGGRFAQLCNASTGIPLWSPTLFNTTLYKLTNKGINTQIKVLETIKFLYLWAERNETDLEGDFLNGQFLDQEQIQSLYKYSCMNLTSYQNDFTSLDENNSHLPVKRAYRKHRPKKKVKKIKSNTPGTTTIKLFYLNKYLGWLADQSIAKLNAKKPDYAACEEAKTTMINTIEAMVPGAGKNPLRKGLKPEERKRLIDILNPEHPKNPYKSKFIKLRNQLIGHLLISLGPRRAELLLMKISDVSWNLGETATIDIQDHPNDPTDTRRKKPEFKTEERRVPLSKDLVKKLKAYIKLRNRLSRAHEHKYLIVGRDGRPLSLSSTSDIFEDLAKIEGLPNNLSPHLLRHTWNDMFSEHYERKIASGELSQDIARKEEMTVRRYHQGWKENSKMPFRYTQRYTEEKAKTVGLEMQADLGLDLMLAQMGDIPF